MSNLDTSKPHAALDMGGWSGYKCSSILPIWKSYKQCVLWFHSKNVTLFLTPSNDHRMETEHKNFCLASTVAGQKCTTAQAALDMGCCYLDIEHVTMSIQVSYCCWQHERIMSTTILTQHEWIIFWFPICFFFLRIILHVIVSSSEFNGVCSSQHSCWSLWVK